MDSKHILGTWAAAFGGYPFTTGRTSRDGTHCAACNKEISPGKPGRKCKTCLANEDNHEEN